MKNPNLKLAIKVNLLEVNVLGALVGASLDINIGRVKGNKLGTLSGGPVASLTIIY
ncbi:MAG: hypothetical protein ABJB76_00910 [Candidatus Nitrosocosmicus sp.]